MNPTFFTSTLTFFLRAFSRVPLRAASLTAGAAYTRVKQLEMLRQHQQRSTATQKA